MIDIVDAVPVDALQHINIRSADVDRARDFYVRILGLRAGDRSTSRFMLPSTWAAATAGMRRPFRITSVEAGSTRPRASRATRTSC